jgi:adenylate cyclase
LIAFPPSRRDLRLASGLTLFAYVATHMLNHALGLISLDAAERALGIAVLVWHSLPGSLLLYGAAGTHLALAFIALYERRTLRMPPMEAVRVLLGFGIPLLLIGHLVATRMAFEFFEAAPRYGRIVANLWLSDGEARQLALLAPGWIHGCLGFHFAFSRRAWYRPLQPLLIVFAVLLPVVSGLGFLAMAREIAALGEAHLRSEAAGGLPAGAARLRNDLLALYFGVLGTVLLARWARDGVARQRGSLVYVNYPDRRVQVPRGWSVLEASRSHHLPHASVCGGRARCSTCRVRVLTGLDACPPPSDDERATLARIGAAPDVRLACQLRPTGEVSVVTILDAKGGGDRLSACSERPIAVLFAAMTGTDRAFADHPPGDLVYVLNAFFDAVGDAALAAGGQPNRFADHHAMALFGLHEPIGVACRQALDAAHGIERNVAALNERLRREFGAAIGVRIGIHAGPAAIGEVGYRGTRSSSAVGETVNLARRLVTDPALTGTILASDVVVREAKVAGESLAIEAIAVEGRAAPLVVHLLPAQPPQVTAI